MPANHRRDDHETSIAAASRILQKQSDLKRNILRILRQHPLGMTDRELERQPEFDNCGPSRIRKRRGELAADGRVEDAGEIRDRMKVWRAIPITEVARRHEAQRAGCLF